MFNKMLAILVVFTLLFLTAGGCKKDSSEAPTAKTMAEYKAEADKEINKDNLQDELDKLEADLASDEATEGL